MMGGLVSRDGAPAVNTRMTWLQVIVTVSVAGFLAVHASSLLVGLAACAVSITTIGIWRIVQLVDCILAVLQDDGGDE